MCANCCKILLYCFACSLLSSISCTEDGMSSSVTSTPSSSTPTTPSALGGTQIYPPPPTIQSTSPKCIFFDSRDNRSRECPLLYQSSCFAKIRRQEDGTYFIKRGCTFNCEEERRNRKIQVCCNTHLCNNHVLSAANFTTVETTPPPQCYQSRTNSTCDLSTACYSRLTYQSDGSYEVTQGCIRGTECEERADNRVIQRCCASDRCNTPIPPSQHPRNLPTFTRTTPTPPVSNIAPPALSFVPPELISDPTLGTGDQTPYPVCYCDNCIGSRCQGVTCGKQITYTENPIPVITRICVNDTRMCMEAFDRDPPVGTMHVLCCAGDLCNDIMPLPTLPEMPSGLVDLTTTTDSRQTSPGEVTTTAPTTIAPSASMDELYFTFTAVISVLAGLIVLGIVTAVLVIIVVHIRRKGRKKRVRVHTRSLRQPDCHRTVCYVHPRDSPLSSSSASSSSSGHSSAEIKIDEEFLKHIGTSV